MTFGRIWFFRHLTRHYEAVEDGQQFPTNLRKYGSVEVEHEEGISAGIEKEDPTWSVEGDDEGGTTPKRGSWADLFLGSPKALHHQEVEPQALRLAIPLSGHHCYQPTCGGTARRKRSGSGS